MVYEFGSAAAFSASLPAAAPRGIFAMVGEVAFTSLAILAVVLFIGLLLGGLYRLGARGRSESTRLLKEDIAAGRLEEYLPARAVVRRMTPMPDSAPDGLLAVQMLVSVENDEKTKRWQTFLTVAVSPQRLAMMGENTELRLLYHPRGKLVVTLDPSEEAPDFKWLSV